MKKLVTILLAVLMLLSLAACAAPAEAPADAPVDAPADAPADEGAADGEKKVIGISLLYRRDEYYTDLEGALRYYGEQAGFEINLQDADLDPAVQQQHIEDFVTAGVDAIALAPTDATAIVPAVEAATAAGIPVFVFDGKVEAKGVVTNVVFDYKMNGNLIGEWAKAYIAENFAADEEVKIAVVDFPQSSTVCIPICDAFLEVIKTIPNATIAAQQDGSATRADSMAVAENILTSQPDIDMFFGINFDTGAGCKAAIEAANSDAVVIAAGWAQEGFEALEANDPILLALSTNPPAVQGEDTIKAIQQYFAGEDVPLVWESTPVLNDANTIADFDWKAVVARRSN